MLTVLCNAAIGTSVHLLMWRKLIDEKQDFKNFRMYAGILFMLISLTINNIMVEPILKMTIVLFILTITTMIIYNEEIRKGLITAIFTMLIYAISEMICIIIVLILTNINSNEELVEIFFGTIYANIVIATLSYMITIFPGIKRIYESALNLIKNQKVYSTLLVVLMIIGTMTVGLNLIFYKNNLILLCCIGLVLLIFYAIFFVNNIMMRNKYLNMHLKYNSTLETLKSYEDILDKYRVSNHENKNQLLMIRNMLDKDEEKNIAKYIDKLVKNEYKDDNNLIIETSRIPSGGLRALIYSKILYMKNNNVKFNLEIDRQIRSVQLMELDENITLDICKIVGVFLDNAIEEVKKHRTGSISIELYMLDDKLNISIGNNFEGVINFEKIDEKKYTTKGEGRGYGLALVKELVNKNSRLENIRMVNDDVFIQVLKITL